MIRSTRPALPTPIMTVVPLSPKPQFINDTFFRVTENYPDHIIETSNLGIDMVSMDRVTDGRLLAFVSHRLCLYCWPALTTTHDAPNWGPIFKSPKGARVQIGRREGKWQFNIAWRVNSHGEWLFFEATDRDWVEVAQTLASRIFIGPGFGLE